MQKYIYQYQKDKKISPTITRMANVRVMDLKGKEIGMATVSKWQNIEDIVNMLIREYEISKVWNSKNYHLTKKFTNDYKKST